MADLNSACGSEPRALCRTVFDWTDNEGIASAADWLVDLPIRVLLIVFGAWLLNRLAGRAIARFTEQVVKSRSAMDSESRTLLQRMGRIAAAEQQEMRSEQRTRTLGAVLASAAAIIIGVVATMLILDLVGLDIAPLIASAGVAGIAIGFGAQSLIRDILVGMFVIIEDQYGVGDFIDVGDATGTVEEVALRTTRLRDAQGVLWIVPNGEVRRVGNYSQHYSKSRMEFEIAYDNDLDHAIEVIKGALDRVWTDDDIDATIIEEPEVLGVEAFRESSVVLSAVVKTEPKEQWNVARKVRQYVKLAFEAEGIDIPSKHRTIRLDTADENA